MYTGVETGGSTVPDGSAFCSNKSGVETRALWPARPPNLEDSFPFGSGTRGELEIKSNIVINRVSCHGCMTMTHIGVLSLNSEVLCMLL